MAHPHKRIEDQVIVITGASSGIGLATAQAAASRGAKVVLAARSPFALAAVCAEIGAAGGDAIYVVADVANRVAVEEIAEAAVHAFGRIDTWVNDAGIAIYGRLDEVEDIDSRKLFETNFWGVVNGSLVALRYLKRTHGALINIGSEVLETAAPLLGMYTASKHAVKGFTDALRAEIEAVDADMSITLIQPTAVDTPFLHNARNYTHVEPQLPTPRIDPEQVAEAILDAAQHHLGDVKVGAIAPVSATASTLAPTLADETPASRFDRPWSDAPARSPAGALYRASESGRVHGTGNGR